MDLEPARARGARGARGACGARACGARGAACREPVYGACGARASKGGWLATQNHVKGLRCHDYTATMVEPLAFLDSIGG